MTGEASFPLCSEQRLLLLCALNHSVVPGPRRPRPRPRGSIQRPLETQPSPQRPSRAVPRGSPDGRSLAEVRPGWRPCQGRPAPPACPRKPALLPASHGFPRTAGVGLSRRRPGARAQAPGCGSARPGRRSPGRVLPALKEGPPPSSARRLRAQGAACSEILLKTLCKLKLINIPIRNP